MNKSAFMNQFIAPNAKLVIKNYNLIIIKIIVNNKITIVLFVKLIFLNNFINSINIAAVKNL